MSTSCRKNDIHDKPNILIIHADQHRADCIGAYGNKDVITPALDELAQDAVVYENHFCTAPVCTPSRYSFFTGLYPHQHHGITNCSTVIDSDFSFPKVLKNHGYKTACVGKMHFTPTYFDMGFEKMCLSEQDGDGRFEDYYHTMLMENDLIDDIDIIDQRSEYRKYASDEYFDSFGTAVSDLPEKYHSTAFITDNAVKAINDWSDCGNLLMVGYIKPHHPFDPSKEYVSMYDGKDINILPGYTPDIPAVDAEFGKGYFDYSTLTKEKLLKTTKYYYAAITQIDFGVKRIIDTLKKKGLYDKTLIIYTSDHGDYMGYHHMLLKGNHMYDPLMHIPLIVKYPENASAGTKNTVLSSNIDVKPTILDRCLGEQTQDVLNSGREYVVCEGDSRFGKSYAVRSKHYKLIVTGNCDNALLFNLDDDPFELDNLADKAEYGGIVRTHLDYLLNELLFKNPSLNYVNKQAAIVDCISKSEIINRKSKTAEYFKNKSSVTKNKKL